MKITGFKHFLSNFENFEFATQQADRDYSRTLDTVFDVFEWDKIIVSKQNCDLQYKYLEKRTVTQYQFTVEPDRVNVRGHLFGFNPSFPDEKFHFHRE